MRRLLLLLLLLLLLVWSHRYRLLHPAACCRRCDRRARCRCFVLPRAPSPIAVTLTSTPDRGCLIAVGGCSGAGYCSDGPSGRGRLCAMRPRAVLKLQRAHYEGGKEAEQTGRGGTTGEGKGKWLLGCCRV